MEPAQADRLAVSVLHNLATPWPYHSIAMLRGPDDPIAPAERTPMFASSYDWHSSVHNHWALARLVPHLAAARRAEAERALAASLTAERAAIEARQLEANPGFERPYGLAWLWTLCRAVSLPALAPLEAIARARLVAWAERLAAPIRSGEHAQSMFAMALAWDAADGDERARLAAAARRLHERDRDAALHLEPSAYDFLSPTLATAWLMLRVMDAGAFARWLDGWAPGLGRGATPAPAATVDRADGKLVHWDGLNLSRAWMLRAIARALPDGDARVVELQESADAHLGAGLASLDGATYAGTHWLPTFATYALLLRSGRSPEPEARGPFS
jgi:hypothetical protein